VLITVMGPTSAALGPDAVHRDLTLIRGRLDTHPLRPGSAFDLVTAIRLQMLRSQESLVADAAARATELEKRVMGIDPVKAEAVLSSLFSLHHDLRTTNRVAPACDTSYSPPEITDSQGRKPLSFTRGAPLNSVRSGLDNHDPSVLSRQFRASPDACHKQDQPR
jgi:hypothetical protein